ncbi:MAG: 2-phospho-L-lactate guanylyltransferase [Nitrososphaerota archaeon]
MRRVALIPVKRLSRSKTRLGGRLEAVERASLSVSILTKVARACRDAGLHPILLSPDKHVKALASLHGWGYFSDTGHSLRSSVSAALNKIVRSGASEVLVVHADLPFLSPDDLRQIISVSKGADIVLCPNLAVDGTNIVYVKKPKSFRPMYGRESFSRHLRYHLSCGLRVKTFISLGSALDIDTPKDLRLLSHLSPLSKPSNG